MYARASLGDAAADAAAKIAQAFSAKAAAQAPATPSSTPTQAQIAATKAQASATYQASLAAYQQSLAKLSPTWGPLPTAPYPPSGDDSDFPRTGTQALFVNATQVSAAQLAEPGKIVAGQASAAAARRPTLNLYFAVGACCLVGYFVIRK